MNVEVNNILAFSILPWIEPLLGILLCHQEQLWTDPWTFSWSSHPQGMIWRIPQTLFFTNTMTICSVFIVLNLLLELQVNRCINAFLSMLLNCHYPQSHFWHSCPLHYYFTKVLILELKCFIVPLNSLSCLVKSIFPALRRAAFFLAVRSFFLEKFFHISSKGPKLFLSYLAVVLSDKGAYLPGILSMATLKNVVRTSIISFLHIQKKRQRNGSLPRFNYNSKDQL